MHQRRRQPVPTIRRRAPLPCPGVKHPALRRWGVATSALCLLLVAAAATPPMASAASSPCSSTRTGPDLNGDGFDDAVVGDPYASVNGHREAGAIVVLYGDADCRIGEGWRRVITQATPGVPGTPEAGDHFGWSVALADLTNSRRTDVLVGSPGEDVGTLADAGSVHVVSFAEGRPGAPVSAVALTQDALRGVAEAGDQFGYTVAAAASLGDDAGTLAAAGAPGEDIAGVLDAGEVDAFGFDITWRLTAIFQQGTTKTSPFAFPVSGIAQPGDRFGASLLIAQLNAPFTGDVLGGPSWTYVMGAPGDMVSSEDGAGSVSLVYDQTGATEVVSQDSEGVQGAAEAGDAFGASLAVHETSSWIDAETRALPRSLAVGAPGEDVGAVADAGSVTLFRSEVTGLAGRGAFSQQSAGFAGRVETGDRFGSSVAMRPRLGSSDAVLVVGVPYEDVGGVVDAGSVQTVAVTPTAVRPLRDYTEASANTPGTVAARNRFGSTVSAMKGRTESLWTASSPYKGAGSVFLSSSSGQQRSWVPGRGGVPQPGAGGRFGWAVSGLESGS